MNRNVESRFSQLPRVDIKRSTFDLSHSVKTTFNVGDIIPVDICEVLPGDTFDESTAKVVRLQTPLTPIMDNMYLDTYHFFVPNRLVWDHWKEFNGENTKSAWIPSVTYQVPQLVAPSGGWSTGSLADYFGIPTGVDGLSVNALPFRAYTLIYNEWFRDQNLVDPFVLHTDDTTRTGSNGSNYLNDVELGGMPPQAAKYHDYFTSCLPAPQKGPNVGLPVASGSATTLPVITTSTPHSSAVLSGYNVIYDNVAGTNFGQPYYTGSSWSIADQSTASIGTTAGWQPMNLAVDGSSLQISVGTINDLRVAFQTQKFYEKLARQGSRYTEILRGMFGVISPDARLQRPEYLGGNRIPLNINQVIQSSATQAQTGLTTTPQGTTAAYSLTTDRHHDFKRSFSEHGYIISLVVVRYDHTYQQGLERFWSRKNRFDYYWPVFANIGEQAVLNKEIYAQGPSVVDTDGNIIDDKVFGYQEAWCDYRFRPNRTTSEMRSTASTSLDIWHLGDDYAALPTLSDSWIAEDKASVDRVLTVTSSVANQVFMDMFIKVRATRPMPLYSIPGLIDHH